MQLRTTNHVRWTDSAMQLCARESLESVAERELTGVPSDKSRKPRGWRLGRPHSAAVPARLSNCSQSRERFPPEFRIRPSACDRTCPTRVSGHQMYERARPRFVDDPARDARFRRELRLRASSHQLSLDLP